MKLKVFLAVVSLFVICHSPLLAEATTDTNPNKIKIGLGYGNSSILISLQISDDLIIEPEFSYRQVSQVRESEDDMIIPSTRNNATKKSIGVGFLVRKSERLASLSYGIRVGIVQERVTQETISRGRLKVQESDLVGYHLAPSLGLEYFILENLSLSGEARFYHESLKGNIYIKESNSEIKLASETSNTQALTTLIWRFYF